MESIEAIDSTEAVGSVDSTGSIDSTDSADSILVPLKRPPKFTPHTKGETIVPMGAALLLARAQRALPLCVVLMLAVFCVAHV